MTTWNPELYLKFGDERSRASCDLVSRIILDRPARILDVGCGPGNSTRALRDRWPSSDVVGLDSSEEMIRKATQTYPGEKWLCADASAWEPDGTYSLVFSNAALQWIPDHARLVPRLLEWVAPAGVFAAQVPANKDAPLHQSLLSVSGRGRWKERMKGCEDLLTYHDASFYYDALAPRSTQLDIWCTTYYHRLPSHRSLIEWYSSTGMRPFLERLSEESARTRFQQEVLDGCMRSYPSQQEGTILFPFQRLFMIAYTLGEQSGRGDAVTCAPHP